MNSPIVVVPTVIAAALAIIGLGLWIRELAWRPRRRRNPTHAATAPGAAADACGLTAEENDQFLDMADADPELRARLALIIADAEETSQ